MVEQPTGCSPPAVCSPADERRGSGARTSTRSAPFASLTKAKKPDVGAAAPASAPQERPATDVVAGATARAASQATIHPLDTMKVRMQAGRRAGPPKDLTVAGVKASQLHRTLSEVGSLYKGVLGAATGAGIIIGSYFAFYSNTKKVLRERTDLPESSVAFVAGATAAVGSSVVKVPLAVCIRSVQAGVYPNAVNAAKSILNAAGLQGLFTGFLPTLLEDVPDMAVKFTVYETLRAVHLRLRGEQPSTLEDLVMGGTAGAAAAAATTPLDVVKTRMMCSASERPTIAAAVRGVLAEGGGSWKAFFRGVGPRALSNGLNSAIFFCFFEAIRRVLLRYQHELRVAAAAAPAASSSSRAAAGGAAPRQGSTPPTASLSLAWAAQAGAQPRGGSQGRQNPQPGSAGMSGRGGSGCGRFACLSLALPLARSFPS